MITAQTPCGANEPGPVGLTRRGMIAPEIPKSQSEGLRETASERRRLKMKMTGRISDKRIRTVTKSTSDPGAANILNANRPNRNTTMRRSNASRAIDWIVSRERLERGASMDDALTCHLLEQMLLKLSIASW